MTFANCAVAVCVVFFFLGTAVAQDRMPLIPEGQDDRRLAKKSC